jgi:hypothetical protein
MKNIHIFYTYLLIFIISFLNMPSAYSKGKNIVDSTAISQEIIDTYAQAGNEALNKLIAQNAINEQNGESYKNNYIFGFGDLPDNFVLPPATIADAKYSTNYSTTGGYNGMNFTTTVEDLNVHLRTLNVALAAQMKPLIYIGIDTKLGLTIRKEAVKTIGNEASYQDFDNATLNINGYNFDAIRVAYNSIYTKISQFQAVDDLTGIYNKGIEIIGIGFHVNFSVKDIATDEVDVIEKLKKKTNGKLWVLCNFDGRGTPDAINWSKDNTVRQTVYDGVSKYPEEFNPDGIKSYLTLLSSSIQTTLLGTKTFNSEGFLYDDCYGPAGGYKSNLDADVTDEQVKRVNALIKEMMDNTLYASYIKVSLDTKTVGGGKIKQIDLINMEKALISLKSACEITYNQTSAAYVTKLINFLTQCSNTVYQPCEATTYVPRCFWDNPSTLPPGVSVADIPVCAGIIDGAIETVWGVLQLGGVFQKLQFDLTTEAACMLPGATLLTDACIEKRENFKGYFKVLSDIPKAWDDVSKISSQISSKLGTEYNVWLGEILSLDNCGRYRQGRLIFDVASLFVGAGEFKLASKGFSVMQTLEKFAQKATQTVGKIAVQTTTKGVAATLKKVTVTLANKSRTVAMAVVLGAATTSPNTFMHIVPKATAAMEWASSKVSSLARPIAEASANAGDDMVARVLIDEAALEAGAASEIASATTREVVNTSKVGQLETVKDLANASQRPTKSIPIGAGESIESSVVTTVSGKEYMAVEVVNTATNVRKLIAASVLTGNTFSKLKPKQEDANESTCSLCSQRLTNSTADQALCANLKSLAARNPTNGQYAVDKLCRNLPAGTNTVLQSIVNKLLPMAETPAFLDDINSNTSNLNHIAFNTNIAQITPAIIDAWKIVYDEKVDGNGRRQNYKLDFKLLDQIASMKSTANNTMYSTLGGDAVLRELIKKNVAAPCNTCANSNSQNYLNKMDGFLKDVQYFVTTYGKNDGGNRSRYVFSGGLLSNSLKQRGGATYVLKVINENRGFLPSDVTFESYLTSTGTVNGCQPDARRLTDGSIYEFKSWSPKNDDPDLIDQEDYVNAYGGISLFSKFYNDSFDKAINVSNSYTQFRCYLANISNMNQLKYIVDVKQILSKGFFDAEGSSTAEAYVKNAFKGLFTKQLQPINGFVNSELFNIIWNNIGTANNGLRQSLFGNRLEATALIYFKNTLVPDTNSSLYDFINMK